MAASLLYRCRRPRPPSFQPSKETQGANEQDSVNIGTLIDVIDIPAGQIWVGKPLCNGDEVIHAVQCERLSDGNDKLYRGDHGEILTEQENTRARIYFPTQGDICPIDTQAFHLVQPYLGSFLAWAVEQSMSLVARDVPNPNACHRPLLSGTVCM
jgi:hypothetical protein